MSTPLPDGMESHTAAPALKKGMILAQINVDLSFVIGYYISNDKREVTR